MYAVVVLAMTVTTFLQMDGREAEGGASGVFQSIVDMRTGASRVTETMGPMRSSSGFDGHYPWTFGNGIAIRRDLPASVANARALAFVARLGWLEAPITQQVFQEPGADVVHVSRQTKSGPTEITIDADEGRETIILADWRRVDDISYPFSQTTTDSVGEKTVIQLNHVFSSASVPPDAFAMPSPVPHGTLAASTATPVPFSFLGRRDVHILVEAKVNGNDARLIFDNVGSNYFDTDVAKRWGVLATGGLNISGAGTGSISGGYGKVDLMSIGPAQLHDEIAVLAQLPWPVTGTAPQGLTGAEFLAEFRTTIDYLRQTLTFEDFSSPATLGGTILPFYSDGSAIYVNASVNGATGLFRIDSGDGQAVTLFKNFADEHSIQPFGATDSSGMGVGGRISVRPVSLGQFSFGPSTLHDVSAFVSQTASGAFSSRTIAGNLGSGLFRCYSLTFDYRARTVTVTAEPGTDSCLTALSRSSPTPSKGSRRA